MSISFEDLKRIASGDYILNHYQSIGKRCKRRLRGKQRVIRVSSVYGYLSVKLNTILTKSQSDQYRLFKTKYDFDLF